MQLIPNAKAVISKSWAVKVADLSAVFGAAALALTQVPEPYRSAIPYIDVDRVTLACGAISAFLAIVGVRVARVIQQNFFPETLPPVSDDTAISAAANAEDGTNPKPEL